MLGQKNLMKCIRLTHKFTLQFQNALFQICLTPWVNGEAPAQITCVSANSTYGLLAYGSNSGTKVMLKLLQTHVLKQVLYSKALPLSTSFRKFAC